MTLCRRLKLLGPCRVFESLLLIDVITDNETQPGKSRDRLSTPGPCVITAHASGECN